MRLHRRLGRALALALLLGACAATQALELSAAQRAWLAAHPVIRVGADPADAPYSFVDAKGQPAGIAAEITELVARQLGVRMELVPGLTWPQILQAARERRLDLITTAALLPEREAYLAFTRIYLPTPSVVMTRSDAPRLNDLRELSGRRYGVRKDWPELVDLIEIALDAIPQPQLGAIFARWIPVSAQGPASPTTGLDASARAWIASLPVLRVGVLKTRSPFDFVGPDGHHTGLAQDVLDGVGQRTGLKTQELPQASVEDMRQHFAAGELDLMLAVNSAAPGPSALTLTEPYFRSALGVFVRRGDVFLGTFGDLFDRRVAVHQDSYGQEMLRDHPRIAMQPHATLADAARSVLVGQADYLVAESTSALRAFEDAGIVGLSFAGSLPSEPISLRMAVSPRLDRLRPLINAALETISNDEAAAIRKRWVGTPLAAGLPPLVVLWWALVALLLVTLGYAAFYFRARDLRRGIELRAAADRQASDEHVRVLYSQDLVGLAITSPDKVWIRVNQHLCRMLEYSEVELHAMTWSQLTHPDDLAADVERFTRLLAGEIEGYSLEKRFVTRSGRVVPTRMVVRCVRKPDGKVSYVTAAIEDISEWKREIESRLAREALLSVIYDNVSDIIFAIDVEPDDHYRFVSVNASFLAVTGLREDQVVGQPVERVIPARAHALVFAKYRHATLSRQPVSWEEVSAYPAGERTGVVTIAPVYDSHGDCTQLIGTVHDITEIRWAEEELRRLHETLRGHAAELEQRVSERTAELAAARDRAESADRMKSAFLATMSHELRTPLNSIIGFTGILLQRLAGPLNDEQALQMGKVRDSARHLLALINDVLDISKIEAGQLAVACRPLDLRVSIERAVDLIRPLAQAKGLSLVADLPASLGLALGEARRVEQVLINLLGNAVKFTDAGTVTVRARAAEHNCPVRVEIADTGIGISAADRGTLFDPFHQVDNRLSRRHDGTGLGLAIARKLARRMGGEIEVQSEIGRGSVFSLTLPGARETDR